MSTTPKFTLNDGNTIPVLGFGTFAAAPNAVGEAVVSAIETGFRHIDCAMLYENEEEVGAAIAKGIASQGLKREDLFITTKLWCDSHASSKVRPACELSLKKLGLDYVDLYLVHWPTAFHNAPGKTFDINDRESVVYEVQPLEGLWKAMEELVHAGLAKSIGVSNFNKKQIDSILSFCKIRPAVNQVEVSVNWNNEKMVKYCAANNILVEAYAPFGSPGVMQDKIPSLLAEPFVKEIADAHKKKPAHVLLRHAIQRGIVVLAKSVTLERVKSNFDIFDFELTDAEMERLNTSGRNIRLFSIPALEAHPEYPFHDDY